MFKNIKIKINNRQPYLFFLVLLFIFISPCSFGDNKLNSNDVFDIEGAVDSFIGSENKYIFSGLASYYNNINYYILSRNSISKVEVDKQYLLKEDEWLAVVSRLNVLSIKAPQTMLHLDESKLNFDNEVLVKEPVLKLTSKSESSLIDSELEQINYIHLWKPLAWIARLMERILVFIQENISSSWGWSIVIFSVLIKLLLLPVGLMVLKFQRKVSQTQTKLAPKLAEIKASYDGEEAHDHLMAAYKELGVSPFFTLKPMLGSFIQIPVLIAIFNSLGEMPQLNGQSFLWIENLAYPDSIGYLPFDSSMFGNSISLLPFIMTVIILYSTVIFKNEHAPDAQVKQQREDVMYVSKASFR